MRAKKGVWALSTMDPASAFPYKPEGSQTCQVTKKIEDSSLGRNMIRVGQS